MVKIPSQYSKLIRQYCIIQDVTINKFLKETFENNEQLISFKRELKDLKRLKNY